MGKTLGVLLAFCFAVGLALAQEKPQATAVICTGVENRTPQGAGESFPAQVGQLYCLTLVSGGRPQPTLPSAA